jgi:hypothetical protein
MEITLPTAQQAFPYALVIATGLLAWVYIRKNKTAPVDPRPSTQAPIVPVTTTPAAANESGTDLANAITSFTASIAAQHRQTVEKIDKLTGASK